MSNPEVERWAHDLCTTQAVASLVERLQELEEVAFRDGNLYWTACGDFVDEALNGKQKEET